MTDKDYTPLPMPIPAGDWNPFTIGRRVFAESPADGLRYGTIVGWGRAKYADDIYRDTGNTEILCDNEGPFVKFDDDNVEWIPGQAMSILRAM